NTKRPPQSVAALGGLRHVMLRAKTRRQTPPHPDLLPLRSPAMVYFNTAAPGGAGGGAMVQPNATAIEHFFSVFCPDDEECYLVLSPSGPVPRPVQPKTGKRWLRSTWLNLAQTSLPRAAHITATLSRHDAVYYGVALQRPDLRPDPFHRSTNAG